MGGGRQAALTPCPVERDSSRDSQRQITPAPSERWTCFAAYRQRAPQAVPQHSALATHALLQDLTPMPVTALPPNIQIPVDGECMPQEPDREIRQIRSVPDSRCACEK